MGDTARALIGSPRTRPALLFALALALYLAPFAVGTEYRLFIATQMAAYVLVAIGLNLLNGYGGQVSLGHGALVAIGAYTVALAMVDHQWSFWPAALLALAPAGAVRGGRGFCGMARADAWLCRRRRHSQTGATRPHASLVRPLLAGTHFERAGACRHGEPSAFALRSRPGRGARQSSGGNGGRR